MAGHTRIVSGVLLVLIGLPVLTSCSSDSPTGPQLGDLFFVPGNVQLTGHQRNVVVALRNVSDTDLGPSVVGHDDNVFQIGNPDELCDGFDATVVGSPVPILTPGGEANLDITIDMSSVDPVLCPSGTYRAPFIAAIGSQILAVNLFIEFEWDGTLP